MTPRIHRGHVLIESGAAAPILEDYAVTGRGPGGAEQTITVQATGPADAIAEAKKKVAWNALSAVLSPSAAAAGVDPSEDLTGAVEVPEGVHINDFIQSQRSTS